MVVPPPGSQQNRRPQAPECIPACRYHFLTTVWRSGALQGLTADEAFFVRSGRDTMTQDDIDNGRLICEIGTAPVKPAHVVIFRIEHATGWGGGYGGSNFLVTVNVVSDDGPAVRGSFMEVSGSRPSSRRSSTATATRTSPSQVFRPEEIHQHHARARHHRRSRVLELDPRLTAELERGAVILVGYPAAAWVASRIQCGPDDRNVLRNLGCVF